MSMRESHAAMDAMRHGIETRDAAELTRLYADNAVMEIVDQTHPPSTPQRLQGRAEIGAFLKDICGREMSHKVTEAVADGGHLAFSERCEYPDGTRVLMSAFAELADGRIVHQTNIQAWDQ